MHCPYMYRINKLKLKIPSHQKGRFFLLYVDDDDYQDNPNVVPPPPQNFGSNGFDPNPEEQKIKTTLLNNFTKIDRNRYNL